MRDAWRRYKRNKAAIAGLIIIGLFVVLAIIAPWITPYNPNAQHLSQAFIHPDAQHIFGTDFLGRDIFTRIMYGGRLTLAIGVLAVAIGLVVGVPLGIISGYYGGWVDMVLQRVTDTLLSFPGLLLALALVAVLGVGLQNVIISVGISTIPLFIRIARGSVLSVRELTYVEAERAIGQSNAKILSRHILRNIMAPIIVQASLSIGFTILAAAGLGFLGLGVQPPTAEWGTMLGDGRNYLFSAPYITTFPGLAIFLAVLGFNLIGDGLRDAFDPYETL